MLRERREDGEMEYRELSSVHVSESPSSPRGILINPRLTAKTRSVFESLNFQIIPSETLIMRIPLPSFSTIPFHLSVIVVVRLFLPLRPRFLAHQDACRRFQRIDQIPI